MKVSDLQDMLGMIRQMLLSAGSKGPAGELGEFIAAFDPYREMNVKQLAGTLSDRSKKPAGRKSSAKLDLSAVEALINDVRALYDRAGSSTISAAEIEGKTNALLGLSKRDVVRAAEAIGLQRIGSKSIAAIGAEIRKRIDARMGANQRMGMIEVVVGDGG